MNFDELLKVTEEDRQQVREALKEMDEEQNVEVSDEVLDAIIPFAKVLMLEHENFNTIAPYLLEAMEKQYKSYQFIQQIISESKAPGYNIENAKADFSNLIYGMYEATKFVGNEDDTSKKFFCNRLIAAYESALDYAILNLDTISIPIQIIREEGRIPHFAQDGDAGADLYSTVEMDLNPGEQTIIPLGFKVELPEGYAMLIQPRSGQSAKTKLRICNSPGLIDSGYRGEVGVLVENIEPPIRNIDSHYTNNGRIIVDAIDYGTPIHIDKGQRIAQARIVKVPTAFYTETEQVNETLRGEGGFGSTGTM